MTKKPSDPPTGVEVTIMLDYYLPTDNGTYIEEGLLHIGDVRRVAQVASGLEAAAKDLRSWEDRHKPLKEGSPQ